MSWRVPRVTLTLRGKGALDAMLLAIYIDHDKPSGVTLARCSAELARLVKAGTLIRDGSEIRKDERE